MLSSLPKNIIQYLIDELPPYTGLLIIKTDNTGMVLDFHGPHNEYLQKKPEKGNHIHEYIPALYSMIPPVETPFVLNRIKLAGENYADIHLVDFNDDEYLTFIVDQTKEVENIRSAIQKINESKYKRESSNKELHSDFNLNFSAIFDYLMFKVTDEDNVIVDSQVPTWVNSLSNSFLPNSSINLSEVFPYMEVFFIEADEFWNKKKNGKFKSGIWTETLVDGTDLALNAYAIFSNNSKYILVHPVDNIDKEQINFQLAREQKLAFEQLEKADKKLKLLLEYKDKFVSIVSHDLRSPVAGVLGVVDLLINDEDELNKLNEFYVEMIHHIKDEMLRLLDYNDKLYHWSNLELGNFEVVKSKQSLKKIIDTVQITSDKKLKAKNISFNTNLKDDVTIFVDITLFLQVLNNLVSNAIKFTPENGNISIDVDTRKVVIISVIDSGVGMPKKILSNIFSGFARNSSIGTDGEKGTGLGLGIVKKIIDAHGFNVTVESELGKGSKFIIDMGR